MNEYASVLLYVMRDEYLAYLCFCSIMRRIRTNFCTDGEAIQTKFLHLRVLLEAIDPVYWDFFGSCDARMLEEKPIDSNFYSSHSSQFPLHLSMVIT